MVKLEDGWTIVVINIEMDVCSDRVDWTCVETFNGATSTKRYKTNEYGEGLWQWDAKHLYWSQLAGTSQFSLPKRDTTLKNRRRSIIYRIEKWLK